jgi:cytochrome c553
MRPPGVARTPSAITHKSLRFTRSSFHSLFAIPHPRNVQRYVLASPFVSSQNSTNIDTMNKILLLAAVFVSLIFAGPSTAADVQANWTKHCVKCHSKDGKGNTKMGRQAGVKDYTDPKVQAEMKDDKALKTIKEGITENGKEKMKAYAADLTDDEIKALIAYMRTFKK